MKAAGARSNHANSGGQGLEDMAAPARPSSASSVPLPLRAEAKREEDDGWTARPPRAYSARVRVSDRPEAVHHELRIHHEAMSFDPDD